MGSFGSLKWWRKYGSGHGGFRGRPEGSARLSRFGGITGTFWESAGAWFFLVFYPSHALKVVPASFPASLRHFLIPKNEFWLLAHVFFEARKVNFDLIKLWETKAKMSLKFRKGASVEIGY